MSNRRKLRPPMPRSFVKRQGTDTGVQWNGEPAKALRVLVEVADAPEFPQYWARHLIGTTRWALRVTYYDRVFYIDDEDGQGSYKVTHGGGPGLPSRSLAVARVIVEAAR